MGLLQSVYLSRSFTESSSVRVELRFLDRACKRGEIIGIRSGFNAHLGADVPHKFTTMSEAYYSGSSLSLDEIRRYPTELPILCES
jgi:hypothetical protein